MRLHLASHTEEKQGKLPLKQSSHVTFLADMNSNSEKSWRVQKNRRWKITAWSILQLSKDHLESDNLSNCNQVYILQEHYIWQPQHRTNVNERGVTWVPLYRDIPPGNTFCSRFDRKQAGKEQFHLDLPVCFWICIPGIARMTFIYLV